MPTYNYKCSSCEHAFELFTSISNRKDPVSKPCPECGESTVEQAIGSPLIVSGINSPLSKTSDGWNDVLKKVKSGSGRSNTIHVK